LNMEAAFTVLLAVQIFHEHYGRRLVMGLILILVGSGLLSWYEKESVAGSIPGVLAIIGACGCWAIDNNLTRQVQSLGAAPLAATKGIVAGGANLILALAVGQKFPHASLASSSMVIGFIGYGLSLVFFIFSLRRIGAARTSAYFSTAPFVGAILSVLMFGERVTAPLLVAGCLMGTGVWLHLSEVQLKEIGVAPVVE
jgi:drug/metabolite transporter (DMT)-like permease